MSIFSHEFTAVLEELQYKNLDVVTALSRRNLVTDKLHYVMIDYENPEMLYYMKPDCEVFNEDGTLNIKARRSGKVIRTLRTILKGTLHEVCLTDRDYELFLIEYKRLVAPAVDESKFALYSGDMIDEGYCQDNYLGFNHECSESNYFYVCDECDEIRQSDIMNCTCHSDPDVEEETRGSETHYVERKYGGDEYDRDDYTTYDYTEDEVPYTLGDSCMRYYRCVHGNYFEIYKDNAKLLVLLIDGKIAARALVWYNVIDSVSDKPLGTFMDRIYAVSNNCEDMMINYAKSKKWMFKVEQSSHSHTQVTVYDKNLNRYIDQSLYLKIPVLNKRYENAPYFDTFSILTMDKDGLWLNNVLPDDQPHCILNDTDGDGFDFDKFEHVCITCRNKFFITSLVKSERTIDRSYFRLNPVTQYICDECIKIEEHAEQEV